VRLDLVDVPDAVANDVLARCPDRTWSEVITDSIIFAMYEADRAEAEAQPG
jgi:hypothetical protein